MFVSCVDEAQAFTAEETEIPVTSKEANKKRRNTEHLKLREHVNCRKVENRMKLKCPSES